jgi:hypothetical protein
MLARNIDSFVGDSELYMMFTVKDVEVKNVKLEVVLLSGVLNINLHYMLVSQPDIYR